jgi:hypothetical protein
MKGTYIDGEDNSNDHNGDAKVIRKIIHQMPCHKYTEESKGYHN